MQIEVHKQCRVVMGSLLDTHWMTQGGVFSNQVDLHDGNRLSHFVPLISSLD